MTQTELQHLTDKSIIPVYTLNTYPEAQILVRFALRLAISEIQHVQGRQKLEMHQTTQTELQNLAVKSTLHTLNTNYPEAQILVHFALRLAISEIQHVQGRRKSEMN